MGGVPKPWQHEDVQTLLAAANFRDVTRGCIDIAVGSRTFTASVLRVTAKGSKRKLLSASCPGMDCMRLRRVCSSNKAETQYDFRAGDWMAMLARTWQCLPRCLWQNARRNEQHCADQHLLLQLFSSHTREAIVMLFAILVWEIIFTQVGIVQESGFGNRAATILGEQSFIC